MRVVIEHDELIALIKQAVQDVLKDSLRDIITEVVQETIESQIERKRMKVVIDTLPEMSANEEKIIEELFGDD